MSTRTEDAIAAENREIVEKLLGEGKDDAMIYASMRKAGNNAAKTMKILIEARKAHNMKVISAAVASNNSARERDDVGRRLLRSLRHKDFRPDDLRAVRCRGLSPLLYSVSTCDEELSLELLKPGLSVHVDVDASMEYGNRALHIATANDMENVVIALLKRGADPNAATSSDVRLQFSVVQPGGSTALHIAAAKGLVRVAEILCESGADGSLQDFDENTPLAVALLSKDRDADSAIVRLLRRYFPHVSVPPCPSSSCCDDSEGGVTRLIAWRKRKNGADRKNRAKRSRDAFRPLPSLKRPHVVKKVWSISECERVLSGVLAYTKKSGWTSQRHRGHASTRDVQSREVEAVDMWVRTSIKERLWPLLARRHDLDLESFAFRDLFFVKYSAEKSGQCGVGIHRDGTVLSFNILLNSEDDFEGGGTYMEATDVVHTISRGDCLVHSGKVRHGGSPISSGNRFILVGFLDAQQEGRRTVATGHDRTCRGTGVEIHTSAGDRKTRIPEYK